jgi:hypothetical protein
LLRLHVWGRYAPLCGRSVHVGCWEPSGNISHLCPSPPSLPAPHHPMFLTVLCRALVVFEVPGLQCPAVIYGTRRIRMAVSCVGVPLTASVQHVQDDARLLHVVCMESTPGHLLRHDGCTTWLPIAPL